ncbi:putative polyketide synthase [Truncatella angustata]|uniref:Polyketide synthase n=1 Tax=Truncatella angustata TaxID=152316 RepID=A0A9P8UV74_9PEZI|nr:putative polyketide synthase [Truncatella angustata]KAH6658993.1 putative polyketide synthase [Truncatella angustata]
MLSPNGRSKMWDRDADGYARGEGVGALVLKPLSQAIADGDHIECVIRETGLNQDGATTGITMPSAYSQRDLIRSTYRRAGLNLSDPKDRPQYFEAHGTGTPAGDPQEAEAIYRAFGESETSSGNTTSASEPLYVGSIKTVLGHTEGTAGVAAILKASLALQNSIIPPNLLFDNLSPAVEPFYKNVEILRALKRWPKVHQGQPRRASVNSFGFGGANAHAILESYDFLTHVNSENTDGPIFSPFVFSAFSEQALRGNLSKFVSYLEGNPSIDPRDLAYTLRERRSVLSYRAAIAAGSIGQLATGIAAKLQEETVGTHNQSSVSKLGKPPKILGIFTGQGAQYPQMGAELVQKSPVARKLLQDLEWYLAQLPGSDRPTWSLQAELLADSSSSRVNEAVLSQPLCTAVQIILIDLLRLANVEFSAVVGHSSGEIAAAYAAGYITARDAICIAYYRGLQVRNAKSPAGSHIKGAMMAVGSSTEDVAELCADEQFVGRISIAASNSSSSVTVSGDEDAIAELQVTLDDEKIFNRRLKVDTAYHSSHMLPCYDPYVASLRDCGITVRKPSDTCTWISSVHNKQIDASMSLADTYWADNMTKPVLFTEALTSALSDASYNLVLEIGCHPALKGPATQTIQEALDKDIPYHGVLARGTAAIDSFATALGFLWSRLGRSGVNLDAFERAMTGNKHTLNVVKGMPTYAWNHETKYWHESRSSKKMRLRKQQVHSLLGDISSESSPHCMIWRNLLRLNELEWISGHRVQGQPVYPAAGYLSTALEAARILADDVGKNIRLIEIKDFSIHQAVVFPQDDAGIEILISLADITREKRPDSIKAKFTYSAAVEPGSEDLALAASGDVIILLGDTSSTLLPERKPAMPHVIDVEPERFYTALADLGYNFSGRFRSLSALQRKHHHASCLLKLQPLEEGADPLLIHPAELDAALQSIILAYSYPYDERLRTMHLPTTIRHIRVNPDLCGATDRTEDELVPVDSAIADGKPGQRGITGHVNLFSNKSPHASIQIQGAEFMPLGGAASEEDRRVFSKVQWIENRPDGEVAGKDIPLIESHTNTVRLLERIASFYLRKFHREVAADDPVRSEFPTNWYLNYARYVTEMVEGGKHKWAEDQWLHDTIDDIKRASAPFAHLPDVQIMHLTGEQMPRVFKGETTILEQFRATDILDRYYATGFGLHESAQWVSRTVKQITDRYPHMDMLEIGAGTGGATKAVMREIGKSFRSYTYTDISAAFFENASNIFSQQRDRMIFKTLDAEKDPLDQGFVENSYDIVVAFFVIHATSDLERALRHIRRLLKPGGYLVVGEGQEGQNGIASSGFIFGTLPGWWLGTDQGRTLSPHVSPQEWDELLRKTGFSGVDSSSPSAFEDILNVFHFATQAVDDKVAFFREPLATAQWRPAPIKNLVIVGGQTPRTSHLVKGLSTIAQEGWATNVHLFDTLTSVDYNAITSDFIVVSLTELDSPVFKDIRPQTFEALKRMFGSGKKLLWVTSGRRDDEPFSNMTVGFGRVAVHETPELNLQQLDITKPENVDAKMIAEILLRFHAAPTQTEDIVWTVEPEIVIDDDGRQLLARLRPTPELNDRYNSSRRPIIQEKNLEDTPFALALGSSGPRITEVSRYVAPVSQNLSPEKTIDLHVTHSVLKSLKTPLGHMFLVLGTQNSAHKTYVALVPSLASVVSVSQSSAIPLQATDVPAASLLTDIAAHIISLAILDPLYSDQSLLVHNATDVIARALDVQAKARNVHVIHTTDSKDENIPDSWIKLPRYVSLPELDDVPLNQISGFAGFSSHDIEGLANEATLIGGLPTNCNITTTETIYSLNGSNIGPRANDVINQRLSAALHYAQTDRAAEKLTGTISLDELVHGETLHDALSIIDWTSSKRLPVQVTRFDDSPMFKSKNSTYWIIGMVGALGISLCDWMVSKGARSIVLTSRNPKVAPEWIATHKRHGAIVTIFSCDVTDEAGLRSVHQKIRETLPPIVGVMNGAMVLRDVSINNMSFGELNDVLKPKVNGSIIVDRMFENDDLDFFILVSSINCVIGNLGQANYAAANTFMCALAAQRRKRGLRAVTLNGGAIVGAGYMERESSRALDMIVKKLHMMRMSEEDWCQSFCEAIDASRLESPYGPELTTGLSDVPFDTSSAPYWFLNPMFSSFIVQQKAVTDDKAENKGAATVQQQLQNCKSQEDVYKAVKGAFATQLRNILQMTTSDEDLMASRSNEIGLDSLVSVDIRSWFLDKLQVSIPVLKIMGNDTMESLVQHAVETLPAELIPHVSGGTEATDSGKDSSDSSPTDEETESGGITPPTNIATPASFDEHAVDIKLSKGIDWEAEARPPADLDDIERTLDSPVRNPPKVVVLTGAGGLLGHNLVEYLLANTSVEKIICIALRGVSKRLRNNELPQDPRAIYHEGDLTKPLLGLSPSDTKSIFAEADVVIHNGADTSHMKLFADLRTANVGSTRILTRLCLPRRIPLHYVSSAGLAVLYGGPAFPEVPITGPGSSYPAPDGSFGYMCSKWTNERFLEQVHEKYGLPVCFHRPSTIVREGTDAEGRKAQLDWVNALLHYARKIKAVPRAEYNRGALDLVYVKSVCADIVKHIMDGSERARSHVTYVNEVGDVVLPLDTLQDIGLEEKGHGKRFDVLPMVQWTAKAIEAGLHPAVAALVEMMDDPAVPNYPRLLKGTAAA